MRLAAGSPVMIKEYPPPNGPRGSNPPFFAYSTSEAEISSITSGQARLQSTFRFHWVSQKASEVYILNLDWPFESLGIVFTLNTASLKFPLRPPLFIISVL